MGVKARVDPSWPALDVTCAYWILRSSMTMNLSATLAGSKTASAIYNILAWFDKFAPLNIKLQQVFDLSISETRVD